MGPSGIPSDHVIVEEEHLPQASSSRAVDEDAIPKRVENPVSGFTLGGSSSGEIWVVPKSTTRVSIDIVIIKRSIFLERVDLTRGLAKVALSVATPFYAPA